MTTSSWSKPSHTSDSLSSMGGGGSGGGGGRGIFRIERKPLDLNSLRTEFLSWIRKQSPLAGSPTTTTTSSNSTSNSNSSSSNSNSNSSGNSNATPMFEVYLNFDAITDETLLISGILPYAFRNGVTTIELRHNNLGQMTCQLLARLLPGSNLQRLKLAGNSIGDEGAILLAAGLETNRTLVQLNVGNANLGDLGVVALCNALIGHPSLTSLCFRNNQFGDRGMVAISNLVRHPGCQLSEIPLKMNDLSCIEFQNSFVSTISSNFTISILELESTQLTGEAIRSLCLVLRTNTTVRSLNLNRNSLGDLRVVDVAAMLQVNRGINTLGLRDNEVTAAGCRVLVEALTTNETLTGVDLGSNRLGDQGVAFMAELLQLNGALQSLDLSGNAAHLAGVQVLTSALATNSTLSHLDFSYNDSRDEGAVEWAKVLHENASLTRLSLRKNSISNNAGRVLLNALRGNTKIVALAIGNLHWTMGTQLRTLLERNQSLQAGQPGSDITTITVTEEEPSAEFVTSSPSVAGFTGGTIGIPNSEQYLLATPLGGTRSFPMDPLNSPLLPQSQYVTPPTSSNNTLFLTPNYMGGYSYSESSNQATTRTRGSYSAPSNSSRRFVSRSGSHHIILTEDQLVPFRAASASASAAALPLHPPSLPQHRHSYTNVLALPRQQSLPPQQLLPQQMSPHLMQAQMQLAARAPPPLPRRHSANANVGNVAVSAQPKPIYLVLVSQTTTS